MEQNPPPSKCLFPARTRTQAPPIVKPVFWTIVPQGQPGIWFLLFFSPSSDQPHLWNGLLNSLLNGLLDLGLLSIKSVLYTQPVSDLINISDKAIPRLQRKLNNSGLPTRKRKKKTKTLSMAHWSSVTPAYLLSSRSYPSPCIILHSYAKLLITPLMQIPGDFPSHCFHVSFSFSLKGPPHFSLLDLSLIFH